MKKALVMFALLAAIFLMGGNALGESQSYPNISGQFFGVWSYKGGTCQIIPGAICGCQQNVTFINEKGEKSNGYITANQFVAIDWDESSPGTKPLHGQADHYLYWDNPTIWSRSCLQPGIFGEWWKDGQRCSIQAASCGASGLVVFVNEHGDQSVGTINGNVVVATKWGNLSGKLKLLLVWKNGSVWEK